jgi:hypothetical protein
VLAIHRTFARAFAVEHKQQHDVAYMVMHNLLVKQFQLFWG